jgi:hypothetical protein
MHYEIFDCTSFLDLDHTLIRSPFLYALYLTM